MGPARILALLAILSALAAAIAILWHTASHYMGGVEGPRCIRFTFGIADMMMAPAIHVRHVAGLANLTYILYDSSGRIIDVDTSGPDGTGILVLSDVGTSPTPGTYAIKVYYGGRELCKTEIMIQPTRIEPGIRDIVLSRIGDGLYRAEIRVTLRARGSIPVILPLNITDKYGRTWWFKAILDLGVSRVYCSLENPGLVMVEPDGVPATITLTCIIDEELVKAIDRSRLLVITPMESWTLELGGG